MAGIGCSPHYQSDIGGAPGEEPVIIEGLVHEIIVVTLELDEIGSVLPTEDHESAVLLGTADHQPVDLTNELRAAIQRIAHPLE